MARYPYDLFVTEGQFFKVIPFDFTNIPAGEQSIKKYTLSLGWHFVLVGINRYQDTGQAKINITNSFTGESIFTDDVIADSVTGNGNQTFVCPKPFIFRKTETIEVKVVNTGGTTINNLQIVLIGYKDLHGKQFAPAKLPEARYKFERLYVLPFDFSLDAGQTLSVTKSISKEFDFQWEILNARYDSSAFTMQLRDGFVNEDFFEGNVYGSSIAGDGKQPFYLPIPYIFKGGTNIKMTVNNLYSGTNNIQVILIGYKIKKV
jgi:hypothetical protein